MDQDAELLRKYLESQSETSFTELVHRHLPLVYSAALRQVGGDPHRAQEVAQAVFTLFARKASQLRNHPALNGWLYTSTHYLAARLRRSEQRRLHHEREAHAMHDQTEGDTMAVDWERLRPVIDEAMLKLKEHDRAAILLRYFENRTYGEIGAKLCLSENTARMRVDRALDALRAALVGRGIVSATAALSAVLSSQATVAIPAGVAANIVSSALATTATSSITIFMSTTLFKTATISTVILAGATGLLLQHQEIEKLRAENHQLQQESKTERIKNPGRTGQFTSAAQATAPNGEVARLQSQVAALKSSPSSSWQERVGLLREVLEKIPEQGIPEMQLATDDDWLDAAKEKLETGDDYRRAFAKLRNIVVGKFAKMAQPALAEYLKANGKFPSDVSQLQAYLDRPIDQGIWSQYAVMPSATISNVRMGGDLIITRRGVVDPDHDLQFVIGPNGHGNSSYGVSDMMTLYKTFNAANPGRNPSDLSLLLPYATTPGQKAALERAMKQSELK